MRWGVALVTALYATTARAHVSPSVDDNNRYVKLTPYADRVRLAYTVFFGDIPGAQTRPGIDADHDGTIADTEATAFASKLAAEIAAALEVTLDRVPVATVWTEVVVGMGSPSVKAGSFSIDLIASYCFGSDRGRHAVHLRDRFRLLHPGETEVRLDDSPGITLDIAHVGPANDPSHNYRFVGPVGPLSDDGIELVFDVGDRAPTSGSECGTIPDRPKRLSTGLVVGLAAVLGFVLAAAVALVRWRKAAR